MLLVVALSLASCTPRSAPTACPPLESEPAPAAAEALEQRISALADAGGLVSLTLTEDEATAYLRHRLVSDDAIEPRITLREETICAQMNLPCLGQRLLIVAELAPYISDGNLAVDLTTLSLQRRSVPGWLRRSAESTLNELLVELSGAALVRSVSLVDHALTLVVEMPEAR
ncbi:MAG: hypothetical protein ACP5G7_12215 [Anaerolineae bacterium]